MENRLEPYDFIRSLAIIFIFLYHITNRQAIGPEVKLTIACFAGLALSLLGFISATIGQMKEVDYGIYIIKRITRIYIPLFICLVVVLFIQNFVNCAIINQHTLLHFLGLSLFFKMFNVTDQSSIGGGLWYITTIMIMYFMLPSIVRLFRGKRKNFNLLIIIIGSTMLNFMISGVENFFTILISYSLGVYIFTNNLLGKLLRIRLLYLLCCSCAFFIVIIVTGLVIGGFNPITQLLLALSSIIFFPFLFKLSLIVPKKIILLTLLFGPISFEFYILHFYFINEELQNLIRINLNLTISILVSFSITIILSALISFTAKNMRKRFLYFILTDEPEKKI